MTEEYTLDYPWALTCPECGGCLRPEMQHGLRQFRCHIGHVLTAETMLVAQSIILEAKLAACLMALNERADLCRQMRADGSGGNAVYADALEAARREAIERAVVIKDLLESEWVDVGQAYIARFQGPATPQPSS